MKTLSAKLFATEQIEEENGSCRKCYVDGIFPIEEWRNEQGQYHRVDGPAYTAPSFTMYCRNGLYHREDGPARINKDLNGVIGKYFINGKKVNESDLSKYLKDGETHLWKDKDWLLHRIAGPAVIREYGTKLYYIHGNLHREDGPAVECPDNTSCNEYYINNKRMTVKEYNDYQSQKAFIK